MLDYDESLLTPPDTVSTARADNYRRVVTSPSSIQLVRERLRRSFEETEAVNRIDSVMASRSRFQARTGGSESVILLINTLSGNKPPSKSICLVGFCGHFEFPYSVHTSHLAHLYIIVFV